MTTGKPRAFAQAAFLAAALLALPFFLSRRWRVARRVIIMAHASEIFPFLNEPRNWPRWTDWNRREQVSFSYEGPDSGAGATQAWSSRNMAGAMRLVQSVENEQVVYHADLGRKGHPHPVDGILTLEPLGEATRVTWFSRWDSGPNPYARYRSLLAKWIGGRDFAAGLRNLKELVETKAS